MKGEKGSQKEDRGGVATVTSEQVEEARKEITDTNQPDHPLVATLQRQLANLIILFVNYKHYHWQVAGPAFRDHHLMFDEFAAETEEAFDEIAERIRMIGQVPIFTVADIQKRASVQSADSSLKMQDMIEEGDRNLIVLIREIRQASKAAEEADDPGTVDLLGKVVRAAEKQEWYLRELLKEGREAATARNRS